MVYNNLEQFGLLLGVLLMVTNQILGENPGCKVIHDFPSCKPGCLTNNGGCPNGIACHQVDGRIYRVNGVCYQAKSGCYGCLESGAHNSPDHLVGLDSCDVIADYPSCGQNCLANYGGCPNGNCHQVRDRIYKVNNKCYQAITGCWGCLSSPDHSSHLEPLTECKIVHDFPDCKPNCLTNNGGCPNGINCHQIQNDIYRVNGECYQAISGCYGCLEAGPSNSPQHLRPLGSCSSDTSCDTLQSALSEVTTNEPCTSIIQYNVQYTFDESESVNYGAGNEENYKNAISFIQSLINNDMSSDSNVAALAFSRDNDIIYRFTDNQNNRIDIDNALEIEITDYADSTTDAYNALKTAIKQFDDAPLLNGNLLFFITDGKPTCVGDIGCKTQICSDLSTKTEILNDLNNRNIELYILAIGNFDLNEIKCLVNSNDNIYEMPDFTPSEFKRIEQEFRMILCPQTSSFGAKPFGINNIDDNINNNNNGYHSYKYIFLLNIFISFIITSCILSICFCCFKNKSIDKINKYDFNPSQHENL